MEPEISLQAGRGKILRFIFTYLVIQAVQGTLRLIMRAASTTPSLMMGLLRLMGSSTGSGRGKDEFYDLVPRETADTVGRKTNNTDAFWSMYYQAYNPRRWRMRHMLTMSSHRNAIKKDM